jgi:putative membrane protein
MPGAHGDYAFFRPAPAVMDPACRAYRTPWQDAAMWLILRLLITAAALFVATALVPGIQLLAGTTLAKVTTLVVVALIFGVVNAVLKPIVKTVGCVFYILTLGLIGLVVNALLFLLTSWVAGKLHEPFHITGFWPAFWGAIIVGVVSWLLSLTLGERRHERDAH